MVKRVERLQVNGHDRLEIAVYRCDGQEFAGITTWGVEQSTVTVIDVSDLRDWWRRVGQLFEEGSGG